MATDWQREPKPLADELTRRLAEAGREIDDVLADLPPAWQAAARAVNETPNDRHYGAPAALRIALAYCDWWDHVDHFMESPTHTNLEQHHVVARLRSRITALLQHWSPAPTRGRGQPRRRFIDSLTLKKIKTEYRRRLRAAPAGGDREALRREITTALARDYGYPSASALRDQLFRK